MADNLKTLECPACGKNMTKIFVPEANANIDICLDGCGGIYFDNREFEKFDEKHKNADAVLSQIKDKKFTAVNEKEVRVCPLCGISMSKMGAAGGEVPGNALHGGIHLPVSTPTDQRAQ